MFQSITRYQYLHYDVQKSLQLIEQLGKKRNPKFVIDDENRFVYENLLKWTHCDTSMKAIDPESGKIIPPDLKKGIYLGGTTGSGKSWAFEIMTAYALCMNFQITLGDVKRCLYWGNVRSDVICSEYMENGNVNRYKKMLILGIQDLGAEPQESLYMGNRMNVMRQLLEYRGDQSEQMTLITSNLPMNHNKLVDRYDERVMSRLNGMCNYLMLKGKDRRRL